MVMGEKRIGTLGQLREKSTEKERHRRPMPSSASISTARARAARAASARRLDIENLPSRRCAVWRTSNASRSAPALAPRHARRTKPSKSAPPPNARGETVAARLRLPYAGRRDTRPAAAGAAGGGGGRHRANVSIPGEARSVVASEIFPADVVVFLRPWAVLVALFTWAFYSTGPNIN